MLAFVLPIVGNIFLNGSKKTKKIYPFLDPLPIFNCPIFYVRTLNALLSTNTAS
uniref:Uncharacterized protein U14 n=1 Tax=Hyposoter didymator TaxID=260305 RepID=D7P5N9_HYPDD|nr:unknown [Hyposoter didymator]